MTSHLDKIFETKKDIYKKGNKKNKPNYFKFYLSNELAKNKRYNYNNCNVSVFSLKLYISKTFKIKYN